MPEDEGQLWDLLPLLTEFKQSRLPRILIEQIGNVRHRPAILLRHVAVRRSSRRSGILAVATTSAEVVDVGQAAVMLLLLLVLLMVAPTTAGLLLLVLLLVHPGRVAALLRVELMVPVEVRRGHHLGGCRGGCLPLTMHALRMEVGTVGTVFY